MLITNWLNALVSRIRHRPRYNSRARRALRRRRQGAFINQPAIIEILEDRTLLTALIIDDGDTGFSTSGSDWVYYAASEYYQSDTYYILDGGSDATGSNTASWDFADLDAGTYRLSTHWNPGVDRADNVPFSVSGIVGGTVTDTFDMLTLDTNVIDDGVNWEDLGYFEVAQDGTLTVSISDNLVNGTIYAEAMRLEKIDSALSITDVSVNENSGTATFTVTSSLAVGSAFSVDFATTNGTAIAGSDYTANSGTLNFAGNVAEETQTITVTLSSDNTVELDENFSVDLSNVQATGLNVVLADFQVTGTIVNDDSTVMSLANTNVSHYEGQSGTTEFSFVVNFSNPLDIDFYVWSRALDNTATEADGDFTDPQIGYWATVVAGATTTTALYSINGDTKVEDDEVFDYAFPKIDIYSSMSPATVLTDDYLDNISFAGGGETLWATGTILDDDNHAPVVTNAGIAATEDGSTVTTSVLASDVDSDDDASTLTYHITAQPSEGSAVSNADGTFTFDPETDFQDLAVGETRQVTFTYTGTDSHSAVSNTGTVTVTVTGVNDAPVVTNAGIAATEDGSTVTTSVLASDVDSDDDASTLTYNITAQPSEGSAVSNADGTFTFDPETDFQDLAVGETRQVTFTYTATDSQSAVSNTGTVTVTVTGVNDAPVVNNAGIAATEDGSTVTTSVLASDIDSDDDASTLTYHITAQPSEGSAVSNADGTFTFDPETDFQDLAVGETRQVTFTYTATDSQSAVSNTGTVTVTVTGVNDAPTVSAAVTSMITEDDSSYSLDLLSNATDLDASDTLSIASLALTGGDNSGITVNGNSLEIDPSAYTSLAQGASEVITYTYNVADGLGGLVAQSATITITGVNDAPVVTNAGIAATEDGSTVTTSVLASDVDSDDDASTLTYNITAQPSEGSAVSNADGTFTFDPETDFQDLAVGETRQVTFTYTATDSHSAVSNTGTVTVTVTGVNDAPTVSAAVTSMVTEDDSSYSLDLLTNATDIDAGDTLGISSLALTGGDDSGITVNGNSLEIDPSVYMSLAQGEFEVITYTYNVDDGEGGLVAQAATITIAGTNVLLTASNVSVNEIDGTATFTVTANKTAGSTYTVDFATADGTALAGVDYTATSGTLNFAGNLIGETQTITVNIINEITVESDETFLVNLSNIVSADPNIDLINPQLTGTILNDDYLKIIDNGDAGFSQTGSWITVDHDDYYQDDISYVAGGGTGLNTSSWEFTNLLAGTYRISGNWVPASNLATNAPVTISGIVGGDVAMTVNQQLLSQDVLDDGVYWQDLGFFEVTSNGTVTVTISDDQADDYVLAEAFRLEKVDSLLSISEVSVNEDAGTATFTVTSNRAVGTAISVDYATANATAFAGSDYTATSGTLNFAGNLAGETQTITVTLSSDTTVEADEFFYVNMSNVQASGVKVALSATQVTGTLLNDDYLKIIDNGDTGFSQVGSWITNTNYSYYQDDYSYTDGGGTGLNTSSWAFTNLYAGTYHISGTWDPSNHQPTNLPVTVSGVVGGDVSLTVNQRRLEHDLFDDGVHWQSLGTVEVTSNGTITITISDDQTDGYVLAEAFRVEKVSFDSELSVSNVSVDEDAGTATFTVTSSQAVGSAFSVEFITAEGTAIAGSDYTATNGTLNFAGNLAGETQSITVQINADDLVEAEEYFLVNLSNVVSAGPNIGLLDRQITGTILKDASLEIIDNSDPGYSQTGTWFKDALIGSYERDRSIVTGIGGTGANTSSWAFTNLDPGIYRVSGNWFTDPTMASNIPVTISGIVGGSVNKTIDQQTLAQDVFTDGVYWQDLGYFEVDGNGTITITISDDQADGYVQADAFRVERFDSELSITDVSVDENTGTATFTVTSSHAVGSAFSVDFATADGTAIAGSDYIATSGTLNFAGNLAGETQTVTVNLVYDISIESDETLFVNLSNVVSAGPKVALSDTQGTGTILNDDFSVIDNGDTGFSQTGTWITITNSSAFYQDDYTYVAGGGTGLNTSSWAFTNLDPGIYRISGNWLPASHQASNTPLTISGIVGGDVSMTVNQKLLTQDVFDDGVYWQDLGLFEVDGSGTITVTMSDDQADGYVLGEAFRKEKVDSDLTISDVSINEATGTATFTVTSSRAVGSAFSVDFATADGTATAVTDYTATSGTLNFAGNVVGETQTITVAIITDNFFESDENFFVNLSNVVAAGPNILLADTQATGTILDDDSLSVIDNGDTGFSQTGTWTTVTSSGAFYQSDYTYVAGGGTGLNTSSWAFTNLDPGVYRISGNWLPASHQATNTPVTVSGIVGGNVSTTINQKLHSHDLFDVNVYWQDLGYFEVDGNSTITVTLSDDQADGIVLADAFRVEKYDTELTITDVSVNEDTGTALVTVTSSRAVGSAFSVDYATADGTATAGSDYNATSGTLNFAGNVAGETQSIIVTLSSDYLPELNEDFFVNLSNIVSAGPTFLLLDAQATVTILHDENIPFIDNGDLGYSQTGTWTTLNNGNYYQNDYSYVAGGTGLNTASWEFTNLDPGIYRIGGHWNPEVSAATNTRISISGIVGGSVSSLFNQQALSQDVLDDGVYWQDLGYVEVDSNGTITVTITDDQANGYVLADSVRIEKFDSEIFIDNVAVNEGAGTATFYVVSRRAVGGPFSVDFATADGTALAGSDYTATSGTLTFAGNTAGEIQTITVPISNDILTEADEYFYVNLTNLLSSGPKILLGRSQGIGYIDNDDYSLIIDNGDAGFSQTGTWTTNSNSAFYQDDYSYVAGGGTGLNTSSWAFSNLDPGIYRVSGHWLPASHQATNTPITISGIVGGSVSMTVNQEALTQDVFDDGVYWQDLGFFEVDGFGTITVTMSDDQADEYVLAEAFRAEKFDSVLSVSDVSVNEDVGTVTFTVTSSFAVSSAFSVDFTTIDDTALAGSDYTADSGTLIFAGNVDDEAETITITIGADSTVESDEYFFVYLTNIQASGLKIVLLTSQVTGTILNDD